MKLYSTVLLTALVCSSPIVAHAQDEDEEATRVAKEHYKAGLEAYKAGKYDVAIKELKKAYLLKRIPALLLNIGATYRKMGDLDLALHFYKKYLDEAPADAKDREEVEKIIADVKVEKESGGAKVAEEAPPPPRREREREEAPPVPKSGGWKHTPIDAAPPDTPMDVRVAMPVMKGVRVYVYYRGAGEEEFTPVLMKRRGPEKVGRVPADAMQGKAIQYYIEARDPAGTIVKSSGSQTNPNIVMIDPSARPQLASAERRRVRDDYDDPAQDEPMDEEEQPRRRSVRNLDDEDAPVTGEVDRPRRRRAKADSKPSKFGPMFWGGVGALVLGAAGVGIGGAMFALAQSRANEISDFSSGTDLDGNKVFFNNDPIADQQGFKQFAQVQAEGQTFNTVGIAMTAVGGVALAAGVSLMVADVAIKKKSMEQPRRRRPPRPRYDEEASAKPRNWYLAPSVGPTYAGAGAGFSF